MIFNSQFEKNSLRLGFPAHLYLKPVPTRSLVTWQMLLPMMTIALMYLVSVGCARILLGIAWPIWGPILLLATALACTQAIIWSLIGFQILRFVICFLALAALNYWTYLRYEPTKELSNITMASKMWLELTPAELLTMVSGLVAAYIVAVIGVTRDRRGDSVGWSVFREWLNFARNLRPARQKPFNSPQAAQFWCERREKGWIMPTAYGIFVAMIVLTSIFDINTTEDTKVLIRSLLLLGLISPFFAGVLCGQYDRKSKISNFKAILPVDNSSLSIMILKPAAASLLYALAILAAGILFLIGWFLMISPQETISREWHNVINTLGKIGYANTFLLLCLGIISAWGSMGLVASLSFIGRPKLLVSLWLVAYFVFSILTLSHTFNLIPQRLVSAFLISAPWIIGTACLLGTIWAQVSAHRRGHIVRKTLWLALGSWLILCLFAGYLLLPKIEPKLSIIILGMGLLALPVAPIATAPLALAWNRHR